MNTKKNESINDISLCAFSTETFFGKRKMAGATSFCYFFEGNKYLVTNYHVVFGRNPYTNELLSKMGAIPNKLVFKYYDSNMNLCEKAVAIDDQTTIGLCYYLYEGKKTPCDLVVIEFDPNIDCRCINQIPGFVPEMLVDVAAETFVIGYPKGIDVNKLPIWKRASVASEPHLDPKDYPYFYIDTATREGMSGSPVIAYSYTGTFATETKGTMLSNGTKNKFLGIYSGRDIFSKEDSAQLGVVWKEEKIIEAIIDYKNKQLKYTTVFRF